jgi:predicted RNase H-like HicB family nuclease
VAEALDFPGAVTQGFDLADARLMIISALEDLAQALLEEGKPLPVPSDDAAQNLTRMLFIGGIKCEGTISGSQR